MNAEFQRIVRRDEKAFISDQGKEIEENNRMGKTRDLFMEKATAPHSSTLAWKIPWMEVCNIIQKAMTKTISTKAKCKKAK